MKPNKVLYEISDVAHSNTNEAGRFSSLVLDNQDNPHISCYQKLDSIKGIVKYATRNGSSWISVIDTLYNVELGMSGTRNLTSLKMDFLGNFHLA